MEGQLALKYLGQEEKGRSRRLWEQCFDEDSWSFVDYYYREKCKDNRILVLEEKDGQGDKRIVSMLQRNPYRIVWNEKEYRLDYLVGVATDPDRRHRGYMRMLLNRTFADQYQERMPFTFLMPADPAIYRPFSFAYVYDQPFFCLNRRGEGLRRVPVRQESQILMAGEWLSGWLEKRYRLYALRDPAYMLRLKQETDSEQGIWELLYDRDRLAGMECFWGTGKRERRFLYGEDEWVKEEKAPRPAIMARIIHLEEFMKQICLAEDAGPSSRTIALRVLDRHIPQNQGLFAWRLAKTGSQLQRIPEGPGRQDFGDMLPGWRGREDLTLDIGSLAGWLMGYVGLESLLEGKSQGAARADGFAMPPLQPAAGIFLDEVV